MIKIDDFDFAFDPNACESCGGKCCTGESGYIFASIDELLRISHFLGISFDEFTQKYVKKVGYKFSFLEKPSMDGFACVFFDESSKKCLIYEVRPTQCVKFPFWDTHKNTAMDSIELKNLVQLCKGVKCEKML